MNTYSKALKHINMKDVKKKHQQKIIENEMSIEKNEKEKKYIESLLESEKHDWRKDFIHEKFLEDSLVVKPKSLKNKEESIQEKDLVQEKEFYQDIKISKNLNIQDYFSTLESDISNIKVNTAVNEHHIKKIEELSRQNFNDLVDFKDTFFESSSKILADIEIIEEYIENNHSNIITLREELFRKIELLPIEDLAERVNQIAESYKKISEEITFTESLLNEPPQTNNSDSLTPLNQNFVTLEQLNAHYKLFLARIQQQLSTIGGGGETQLKYLDDIVGISTNASAYDGKFLKYDHSIGKFEFVTVSGGPGISTYSDVAGIATVSEGLTGTPSISVDILEATDALFTGNISILGDFNKVDSNGIITARSGLTIGIPEIPGGTKTTLSADGSASFAGIVTSYISIPTQLRTKSVAEKTTLVSGNTVELAFTTGSGNVAICTNPSGDITLNVTNIPTDSSFDNHSISFSVIVTQTGTARTCTAVNLNGVSRNIRWSGGSLTNAISGVTTSTGFDIFTFTGINTVGSASTTTNYVVLGSVNGGFN